MTTPLIGITTYHKDERGYIQLPSQYAEAVRRAGAIPLLIQPGEPRMDELMALLDGLILSGGGMLTLRYTPLNNINKFIGWIKSATALKLTSQTALCKRINPSCAFVAGYKS
jgi:hypothetical protein